MKNLQNSMEQYFNRQELLLQAPRLPLCSSFFFFGGGGGRGVGLLFVGFVLSVHLLNFLLFASCC